MPASKWNSKWTSKCASRQSGVHFFISYTIRWLRTRRFSEPTFRASGLRNPKTLEERIVSRLLYLFAHLHLLSSDSFSSLILFLLLLFSPLTLPTAAFPSVHIVGSLTSKLPSAIYSDMLQLHQKLVAAGLRAKHIPKAVIRAGFLFAKDHIESCTSPAGHKLGKAKLQQALAGFAKDVSQRLWKGWKRECKTMKPSFPASSLQPGEINNQLSNSSR